MWLLNVEGKPIPTELRNDEAELRKAIEFDDEAHESKDSFDIIANIGNW